MSSFSVIVRCSGVEAPKHEDAFEKVNKVLHKAGIKAHLEYSLLEKASKRLPQEMTMPSSSETEAKPKKRRPR